VHVETLALVAGQAVCGSELVLDLELVHGLDGVSPQRCSVKRFGGSRAALVVVASRPLQLNVLSGST
jgi:hypothetical protein